MRDETDEVGWTPTVLKDLGSNCRLLGRKNNMTKMVLKEGFKRQAEFHTTPQTQKDCKAELSFIHIWRSYLGQEQCSL